MKKITFSIFIFSFLLGGLFYLFNDTASSKTINNPIVSKIDEIETDIYHPFIDDDWNLWGLDGSKLKRSEDFGETWDEWYDFEKIGGGLARLPIYGAVYISKKGYIFVGLEDGKVYRSNEPQGKEFEVVNVLSHPKSTLNVWNITEDNDGVIYHGEYANITNPNYNPETDLKEEMFISVAYVYKSEKDGAKNSWEKIGSFLDDSNKVNSFVWNKEAATIGADKHIHSTLVNPYTNELFVTYGDWNRYTWKSKDSGENWIKTEATEGYTGLTFTENAIFAATDFPYASNNYFAKSVDGMHFEETFKLKDSLDTATYDMHSHIVNNESRVIGIVHDEWNQQHDFQSAVVYTENEGTSWEVLTTTPKGSTDPVYIGLAHGRNSIIPENFPYWIISNHWTREDVNKTGEMKITRIPVINIASKIIIPDTIKKNEIAKIKFKATSIDGIEKIELLVDGDKNKCDKQSMECKVKFSEIENYEVVLRVYDLEGNYSDSKPEIVEVKS
ncbi:hypothetical protein [Lysinibacillus xylanilyticus]|uniref:hypothetical protein n=1 Tax=Lysinibacillus xylanilyticus TaxID=582475 RepID=UPI00083C9563|nr:hypothetical protein [Lysinibacillus xylanilyticus]